MNMWYVLFIFVYSKTCLKAAYSVTMNIFRKKNIFFLNHLQKNLSYVVTINLISTVENCMKKWIIL